MTNSPVNFIHSFIYITIELEAMIWCSYIRIYKSLINALSVCARRATEQVHMDRGVWGSFDRICA